MPRWPGGELTKVCLGGVDLRDAGLRHADLSGSDLLGAAYDECTTWFVTFDPKAVRAV